MTHLRTDIVAPLVAAGTELFVSARKDFPRGDIPRYNVLAWLFDVCAETATALTKFEREHVVDEIHAAANNTIAAHGRVMTVGELRDKLRLLPDNMPVFYQRIEDTYFDKLRWKSHRFINESWPAEDVDRQASAQGGYSALRIIPGPDGDLAQELVEGLGAFTAYVAEDENGRKAFFITAHY